MASLPKSKIFIDSSVLIAASISSKGSARDLIIKGVKQEIELYLSDIVIEETKRNLTKKAPAAVKIFASFLQTLPFKLVNPKRELVLQVAKEIELKDAPIVAGAIQSRVDYLVSYDYKHILNSATIIQERFGLKVVTPDSLVKR